MTASSDIDPEIAARHAEKMAKKRAARDKIMANKDKTGGSPGDRRAVPGSARSWALASAAECGAG